jgi:mRNA interferase HicA
MKRRDVIQRIEAAGAEFVREGSDHTIYRNPRIDLIIPVPRHREIAELLARKIIRDAER